MQDVQAELSCA